MKHFLKKIIPVLLSLFIIVGVVFSSYDTAKATGMEEYLYVTYWDLMNTLYSMCGYDMSVSDTQINTHGVTGKQAWNNFTTFVENTAKFHWKLYSDAGKAAVEELKNLVSTATEKGISISQDLFDMLKDVFGYQAAQDASENLNQFDCSSVKVVNDMIYAITGGYADQDLVKGVVAGEIMLYILHGTENARSFYAVFGVYAPGDFLSFKYDSSYNRYLTVYSDGRECGSRGTFIYSDGTVSYSCSCSFWSSVPAWIINNGAFVGTDTVGAQVSAGACPAEVPDVQPWIKNPSIPDEWRIVQPGEDPKKDPDEKPDLIPGIIPFPKTPEIPDGTETEETETTEKPDEKPDKDKDKEKKPAYNPIINPNTGNVIDPETGLDIDPETGKLIDPETGALLDPSSGGGGGGSSGSDTISKLGKYGDITKLFPFCIPFDIVNLIKGMSAKKAPPVFHFEYFFKSIDYTFKVDVDLSDYDKYVRLFRYGMQIFYVLALMFLTIKISKLFI